MEDETWIFSFWIRLEFLSVFHGIAWENFQFSLAVDQFSHAVDQFSPAVDHFPQTIKQWAININDRVLYCLLKWPVASAVLIIIIVRDCVWIALSGKEESGRIKYSNQSCTQDQGQTFTILNWNAVEYYYKKINEQRI